MKRTVIEVSRIILLLSVMSSTIRVPVKIWQVLEMSKSLKLTVTIFSIIVFLDCVVGILESLDRLNGGAK